jgi:hypothetical protein
VLHIIQQQKQLFSFPLEFAFIKQGSSKNANPTFLIKDKITRAEIPMDAKPTQVIADPATNLLFQGSTIEEISPDR